MKNYNINNYKIIYSKSKEFFIIYQNHNKIYQENNYTKE